MRINYYNNIDFFNLKSTDTLSIINGFKTFTQESDNTCAPACLRMLFKHYGMPIENENMISEGIKTLPFPIGTNLINIVNYLKAKKLDVVSSYDTMDKNGVSFKSYCDFKAFIQARIKRGIPVMVENVDYGGHWKIIIGLDECDKNNEFSDMLIFADPDAIDDFNNNGYSYIAACRFFYMWFDDHCLLPHERRQPYLYIISSNKKRAGAKEVAADDKVVCVGPRSVE